MKFQLFFAWYDFWVGWYWDRKERVLYVCPLPMVVLAFRFKRKRVTGLAFDIRGKGEADKNGVVHNFKLMGVDLVVTDVESGYVEFGKQTVLQEDAGGGLQEVRRRVEEEVTDEPAHADQHGEEIPRDHRAGTVHLHSRS